MLMTDQDFLDQAIQATRFLSEATPHSLFSIKSCTCTHLYCSPYFLELIGASEAELMGKIIWLPLYDNNPEFEQMIIQEDQTIIQNREATTVLKINRFTTGLKPYLCHKTPLINPASQQVVGIFLHAIEMSFLSFHQYLQNALDKHFPKPGAFLHLSKREKQVIFFFMANLSSQAITEALFQIEGKRVRKSTIDSLFNAQLYPKFNVHSRPALYKKLQALGFDKLIPKENLATSSTFLEVMQVY